MCLSFHFHLKNIKIMVYFYKRSRLHVFRNIIPLMQRVMKIDLLSLKVGDSSHISPENDVLCSIINEEKKKESFTVVEIGGISSSHVTYLRQHLSSWTRQLALVEFYVWRLLKCICCAYICPMAYIEMNLRHTWRWINCWSLISISKSCFYLFMILKNFLDVGK